MWPSEIQVFARVSSLISFPILPVFASHVISVSLCCFAGSIEPIPQILLSVIDHLTQWRLIPESKRPNSCLINFLDEVPIFGISIRHIINTVKQNLFVLQDEHSQPYFKPPHFENPISTLFLSETTIAFGRVLSSNQNGDYKGSLTLSLSEGYDTFIPIITNDKIYDRNNSLV